MDDFEFEWRVEVVVNFAVDGKVIETAVAECYLVSQVCMEIVACIVRHANQYVPVRLGYAVDFRKRSKDIADMFQEMIRINDGELVLGKGPRELIEIVDDINSRQGYPIDAEAAWRFAPATPDV